MVRRSGMPENGELVICRITKINPNSAFALLEEYRKEGLIHISEIKTGWVKDIRSFVKPDQMVVAKVIRIDDNAHISLSLKRVDKNQENEKIKEYKLDQRAEKMLELAAKEIKKTLDDAYKEAGFKLIENFGSLYKAFKTSIQNPNLLIERGINEKWVELIRKTAEKGIEQKEFEFKAKLLLKTYKPNGVALLRAMLEDIKNMGFDVRYIAAPEYLLGYKTKNAKKGSKEFREKLEKIASVGKANFDVKAEILKS
jgi:translation initiation factor 2 subunit 1